MPGGFCDDLCFQFLNRIRQCSNLSCDICIRRDQSIDDDGVAADMK